MSDPDAMTISVRRARHDDVAFLLELVTGDEVEPFLGAVSAKDVDAIGEEVERSQRVPHDFGRFVIEADGDRAGAMGFELANRRSRIAYLERLAVHPLFRGRGIADDAARRLQRHLVVDLGYHRLQLEIYGFNERAQRHAERAGFVKEGRKRDAYWRHGTWTDGVIYSLLASELGVPASILLLHDYLGVHNECVRTGDWDPLGRWFADGAELVFQGVSAGPFRGSAAIAAAYREQPPDDQVLTLGVVQENGIVVARYGWLQQQAVIAGRMLLTAEEHRIGRLVVTFEEDSRGVDSHLLPDH